MYAKSGYNGRYFFLPLTQPSRLFNSSCRYKIVSFLLFINTNITTTITNIQTSLNQNVRKPINLAWVLLELHLQDGRCQGSNIRTMYTIGQVTTQPINYSNLSIG